MAIDRNAAARANFRRNATMNAAKKAPPDESPEDGYNDATDTAEGEAQNGPAAVQAPGDEDLSPEEGKVIEQAVQSVGQLLYQNQQVGKAVVELIKQPPHVDGIGQAATLLTVKVDEQMNLPDELVLPVGVQAAQLVSDLGEELGFYSESEKFVKQVVKATMKSLYEHYGVDDQELVQQAAGIPTDQLRQNVFAPDEESPATEAEEAPEAEGPGLLEDTDGE